MMMLRNGDLNMNRASQSFGESAMESFKQAMLQHELIFRNQVRELHRLYWTQKTLMNELRAKGIDACAPSSSPWLSATEFQESTKGKIACLESYCTIEMGSSLGRNVDVLEKVKGNSVDALLKNHQRNCSVQLPANYFLEREFSKDVIVSVSERGNLGCSTGVLIVEKGIRQRAGSFRTKEVIDLEDSVEFGFHEEANVELYCGLELPMKKRLGELCSKLSASSAQVSSSIVGNDMCRMSSIINLNEQHCGILQVQKPALSFAGPGEFGIAAAFDQSSNKQQSKAVIIDLNLPHQDTFSHDLNVPVPGIPFPINDSTFHHETTMHESYHDCQEESSFASKPNSFDPGAKTSCVNRASRLFPPVQVPQSYSPQDSKLGPNSSKDNGEYYMKTAREIRAEFWVKPVEGSTGSTKGTFLDKNRSTISPSGKLQSASHSDNKMQDSNVTSSNSINLLRTLTRDSACKLRNHEGSEEDTLSSQSIAKDLIGTLKESKCRSDGDENATIAAVSVADESVTTQLNSPKNEISSIEELNANISAAAEVLMSISLGRSAIPGQHLNVIDETEVGCDVGINHPQYSSDSFESLTLQLSEIQSEDRFGTPELPNTNGTMKDESGIRLRRGRGYRDFQKEILPGLVTLSRHEICEDLHNIGHRFQRNAARIARENWFLPVGSRSSRRNR